MTAKYKITKKFVMDALAMVGNMVGSLLVAVGGATESLIGYSFFLVGSIATIWLLRHSTASKSLMFITVYFMAVNIFGIFQRGQAVFF